MKDKDKTNDQLIREVKALRQRIAELECSKAELHAKIASLSESNGNYYDLFKNAGDALYITDRDGRFIDANQSFLNLFGYTSEELKNLKVHQTYANLNDRLTFQQEIEHKGFVNDYTVRLRRKDGRELTCLITATVRRTDEGSVLGYEGIIRDISEYTSMTKKVKENERRYQELADLLPLAVFETDEKGNFFFINRQGFKISGYTPAYMNNGLNALQLFVPEDRDSVKEDMRSILSGEKLDGREYTALRKDGSTYPVIIYADPIIVDQRTVGLRGVVIDATERKETEERLRGYQDRLRSLANELSLAEERGRRRIATYLHDHIGHSLAMCKIKLGSLQESLPPIHRNGYVDEIKSIIEHVIQGTRSLTSELSPPVLYEMGLVPAVEWLAENINEQHGILINVHYAGQLKKLNDNLQVLLFQATRELLTNIIKHAQAQNVDISIKKYNNTVQIEVKDDGVGFDTAHLLSTITKNGGFGLFNIRERFDHLGGHVDIHSQPDCGTCITVVAPVGTKE
jgi:PAS domain S-box-containing protein